MRLRTPLKPPAHGAFTSPPRTSGSRTCGHCRRRAVRTTSAGGSKASSFPVVRDVHGNKVLPENLGSVAPWQWHSYKSRRPDDLVRAARANLAVRDGFAAFYFHPFLDLEYLAWTSRESRRRATGSSIPPRCSPRSVPTRPASPVVQDDGRARLGEVAAAGSSTGSISAAWSASTSARPNGTSAGSSTRRKRPAASCCSSPKPTRSSESAPR